MRPGKAVSSPRTPPPMLAAGALAGDHTETCPLPSHRLGSGGAPGGMMSGVREAKELAVARDASEHMVVLFVRASRELFRVREAETRVPYQGNQGRASTGPDPSGKKSRILRIPQYTEDLVISERQEEVNAVQTFQSVREDQGHSIVDMLKALSVELKGGFETSNANQAEIRGLCEDLGKKIDDLAGRTAALEEEVGELRMVVEDNKEQIRYLKEGEAKMESLENNQRRNNLRFLRVPKGLEEGDLKGFMDQLIKHEVKVEESEKDSAKDFQSVQRVPAKMPSNRDRPGKFFVYFQT
ncbi:hypothetical protein NDU88_006780 [Pleurodeles waltl]|uniref:Uncharacterized protein n=1 Tax=Pleurodeles waltl TaxID=8319 RepID=A0AAV7RSZ8_PLEWA|nr:hypothetical protein NDU88_006780 [Pleurodeles waltl]